MAPLRARQTMIPIAKLSAFLVSATNRAKVRIG
jgi:hypothetical protein